MRNGGHLLNAPGRIPNDQHAGKATVHLIAGVHMTMGVHPHQTVRLLIGNDIFVNKGFPGRERDQNIVRRPFGGNVKPVRVVVHGHLLNHPGRTVRVGIEGKVQVFQLVFQTNPHGIAPVHFKSGARVPIPGTKTIG